MSPTRLPKKEKKRKWVCSGPVVSVKQNLGMATGLISPHGSAPRHECAWRLYSCYHRIVLFYHKMHFPPWKQGIYDSCHTSCHTAYWHLCAAESDCVRDDDLGFTSHSASICKHISVVLFYFEVIMMVQETCLKSTCTNCIHVNHSSEQTITHCDCSDYVAYSHHKDVKIWSMF